MIAWLNSCSAAWFDWMAAMTWQSAILIVLLWAADLFLRRFAWPQFRHMLWLLVFIKLLLPPGFALPTSITSSGITAVKHFIHGDVTQSVQFSNEEHTVQTQVETVQTNMSSAPLHVAAPLLSLQSKLMLIWLAGIIMLIYWLSLRLRHLRMERSQSGLPEWFVSVLQECANKVSIKRTPAIAITSALTCPAVFGIFRPTILIPRECIGSLDEKQTSNILIHELMHIKRGDLLVHAIQIALLILYWPNILLWFIRRPMHDLRELCCDASAAAVLRENTPSYRQTLVDMARRLITEPANPGLGLLGLFEQPHAIVARLRYLEKPYGKQLLCKYMTALATLAMIIFVLPMSAIHAQMQNQEKASLEAAQLYNSTEDREKPRFEVVSIKRRSQNHYTDYAFLPGGRLKVINLNLRGLIAECYKIPMLQVVDIPSDIDKAGWDIEAKPEEGKYSPNSGLMDPRVGRLMVQSMLEDNFKLKVHRETRLLPGYELVIAKGGPIIKASGKKAEPDSGGIWRGHMDIRSRTLSDFTALLSLVLSTTPIADVKGPLVVDRTGIKGLYDFKLHWTPNDAKASLSAQNQATDDSEMDFFNALQDQLGLKLAPAKLPTPVVVVDDVQMPATN